MSAEFATTDRVSALQSLTVSGTNTVTFRHGKPMNIKRLLFTVTTAITGTIGAATYGVRNRDGTGSVTLGSFAIPNAAINAVLKADVAGVKTAAITPSGEASQPAAVTTGRVLGYQTNLPGEAKVNPGQEFFVTLGTATSAGVVDTAVEFQEQGNNPLRFNATDMAVTFS